MSMDEPARDLAVSEILFRSARELSWPPDQEARYYEFFHVLRNRLNSLKLGLYIGRRLEQESGRPADSRWDEVERLYQLLEQSFVQVSTIVRPIRPQPLSLNLPLFLQEKARGWRNRLGAADHGFALVVPESPTTAVFDPSLLGQALDQLAAWRFGVGARPRLLMGTEDGDVTLIWDEIGNPSPTEPDSAIHGCCSIALATLARVVASHQGETSVNRDGGFRVRLRWPLSPAFATAVNANVGTRSPRASTPTAHAESSRS